MYGNGLLLDGVTASLAGLPMRFDGGVYGTSAPQVHVTMSTHGDLAALRQVLPQTAQLPLHGPIRLDVTAEGAAAKPLVEIALRSPHASYAAYAVSKTSALLAFDGSDVDLVGFHTHYDGIDAVASGRLGTHAGAGSIEMLARIRCALDAGSLCRDYAARHAAARRRARKRRSSVARHGARRALRREPRCNAWPPRSICAPTA